MIVIRAIVVSVAGRKTFTKKCIYIYIRVHIIVVD